jgi:NAD(P)H-flavin reductase
MRTANGIIEELLVDGSARIHCPTELTPKPGQYLLAHAGISDSPLPVPLFSSETTPRGFRSAPPLPREWRPGDLLTLRGPLGRGFVIPESARKIALIVFDNSPARLQGLIPIALQQNAEVVLVSDASAADLPEIVEVQPLKAMVEIFQWADYAALDVDRWNLSQLKEMLREGKQVWGKCEAQVLVRAPMPCGAIAECGVCALVIRHEWKMVCRDGPVFSLQDLL